MDWFVEFITGVGRFFLHPIFYLVVILSLIIGFNRVKQERRHFHIRIFDAVSEWKYAITNGLLPGLVLSLFTIGLGIVIPVGGIVLIATLTVVFSLTIRFRWLSPAFVIGLALLFSLSLPQWETGNHMVDTLLHDLSLIHPASFAALLAMLLATEAYLIMRNGSQLSSPRLERSRRGRIIGVHVVNRLWMIPMFVLLPGDAVTSVFDWWPLLSIGQESYALCLVPFSIGFYQKIKGSLPQESIFYTGRKVMALAVFMIVLAIVTYWMPLMGIATALLAMIGRELISIQHRVQDDDYLYFSRRGHGLVILGVIPKSPAEKMALQVGEIITKVNGVSVASVDEFYYSLQKNRAFAKLEVIDTNGELRLVQRALYDGEHHELGILFVDEEKTVDREQVG
ncbi:PDZ domain-containing protein [Bacillus salitolerans]|uniref:PDZ domain-containing protein n=1 Tax=Bacillus salitolerans TaxID=1437434 RepID=A0ABW4LNI6_9BACI